MVFYRYPASELLVCKGNYDCACNRRQLHDEEEAGLSCLDSEQLGVEEVQRNGCQIKLSVVMPAYNEEDAIEAAVEEVRLQVSNAVGANEIIVVNDGSRDQTGEILDRLAEHDELVRVIHQANGGHGRALRTGLDAARGEFVFMIDSDRQIPLEAFAPLWKAAGGRDGAFGVRAERHDPRIRLVLTAIVRRAIRAIFKVHLKDANVPFKILKRSVWLEARELIPEDTLAPSIFLAIIGRRFHDVIEMEVPHRERSTGEISIRRWRLIKFCWRGFVQLLAFRRRLEQWAENHRS